MQTSGKGCQGTVRRRILVRGLVQGVGFRPFVYRLSKRFGVGGWVCNSGDGVFIEAEGNLSALEAFVAAISGEPPAMARVDSVVCEDMGPLGETGFEIRKSVAGNPGSAIIPADLAICPDCAADISDPDNRRFEYPFTNCTNCGPRFTIVRDLPYDRRQTTMSVFPMCADCSSEFDDPEDRRFHAQPNACPVCGPEVYMAGSDGISGSAALDEAVSIIIRGGVVAVKSLGGFHMACQASAGGAQERIRKWKNRPSKPFAVMVADIADAERFCLLSEEEKKMLSSVSAPIVMATARDMALASIVAPGLSRIGVMLAYTPLHLVLFNRLRKAGFNGPLVMTSANRQDEPICMDDASALETLSGVCDGVLSHNREIYNRCDDSVIFISCGGMRFVRRARGYVPDPVPLGFAGPCVLAAGAHLKNTFCITRGQEAFMSQHIGDMDNAGTEEFYSAAIESMKRLLRVSPEIYAHDLHPDYQSTRLAVSSGIKTFPVQHHYAHVASVLAEKNFFAPVIGVAFDGTGYGTDGTVWGAEFLVVDGSSWRRRGTVSPVRIPGGDAAVPEIWRSALAYLKAVYGKDWRRAGVRLMSAVPEKDLEIASNMADAGVNSPAYSSIGRLFDAAACLSGIRCFASYEAQGAMELEALCRNVVSSRAVPMPIKDENGILTAGVAGLVEYLALSEEGAGNKSGVLHASLCGMSVEMAERISSETGIRTVALSGGVFQNRVMLEHMEGLLRGRGFRVLVNSLVPANDGGIALGQAWAALSATRRP